LRQSLARKGNKRVSQFSWDTAAKKLADVYKGLALGFILLIEVEYV
jgi:glycosyltransferase involved in cell wall biosynthesis